MERLKLPRTLGKWHCIIVEPTATNTLDVPCFYLFDKNKKFVRTFDSRDDMIRHIERSAKK